jgi:SNF2 family DNA or RNA helicase
VTVGSQQFGARYGEPDPYGGWKLKPEKLPELNQLISQIQLRRMKTDVMDLPPKLVETQWVPLSPAQAKAYKQAKEEFLLMVRGKEESLENILTRLMRFKQITGGLHLIGGDPTAHAKWDAFTDRFTDFLDAGNKLVLFTQFRDQWQFLMDHCSAWHPVGIRGGMSAHEIEHAKTSFQTDPGTQVFVMTHAAREGVTLTAAQTMVFFDLEWSPAWFDQASDRVHRIGQVGTVNIVRLLAPGTIDEKTLLVNLHDKEVLQKIFNKAPATII